MAKIDATVPSLQAQIEAGQVNFHVDSPVRCSSRHFSCATDIPSFLHIQQIKGFFVYLGRNFLSSCSASHIITFLSELSLKIYKSFFSSNQ